jgi:hypothetical protein
MKYLHQSFDLDDDSISYTVLGESEPLYRVDSSGYLTEKGNAIGKFKLGDNQWHLYLEATLFMSGPEKGLFGLPEFELKALTALVNQERPSAL